MLPASGPDFDDLLKACHEANCSGRSDAAIRHAATRMHKQLLWTQRYRRGKWLRRMPGGHTVEAGRPSKPLTDIRRIHSRIVANDVLGFGKAFVESSPYVQDLVRKSGAQHGCTLCGLEALLADKSLRGRPSMPEHKRSVDLLVSLFSWLRGDQPASRLIWNDVKQELSGDAYNFVLRVSLAYQLNLVSRASAHRMRG